MLRIDVRSATSLAALHYRSRKGIKSCRTKTVDRLSGILAWMFLVNGYWEDVLLSRN